VKGSSQSPVEAAVSTHLTVAKMATVTRPDMSRELRTECGEMKSLSGAHCASSTRSLVSVQEGYEMWAPTYDHDLNPLLLLEERTLRPLLPDLVSRAVLDVACGTGRWLEKLLAWGARSGAGVDLSYPMLDVARAKPLLQGRLAHGDCLVLPLRSEVADLVICSFALCHIDNLTAFAQEIARVTKRRGELYLSDLHPEGFAKGWRTGFRHKDGSAEIATTPRSIEQVCKTFQSQGFELLQCWEPRLAEPERQVFANAGKSHLFHLACEDAALFICHFRRMDFVRTERLAPVTDGS